MSIFPEFDTNQLSSIKAAGLKAVRTWAFNDATSCNGIYFQCWSSGSPVINYGSNGLGRLDVVVKTAEKYGIKLVLPMGITSSKYFFV